MVTIIYTQSQEEKTSVFQKFESYHQVGTNRLRYDDSLWQRTSLPLEDITDLLSFCLNTTQFVFEGTYCKQVFGTAMGSPVSAVIAKLVMADIEHRALTTASLMM